MTHFNIIHGWKIYPQQLKEITLLLWEVLVCQQLEEVAKVITTETDINGMSQIELQFYRYVSHTSRTIIMTFI
jgi:hypothetical protein